jgi:hypothetical protein
VQGFVSVASESGHSLGISLKWDRFLADIVDLAFLEVGARATPELISTFADLIASAAFSLEGTSYDAHSHRRGNQNETRPSSATLDRPEGLLGPLAYK